MLPCEITAKLVRIEFEVYGQVQGVFFRHYTKLKCDELNLRGWCRNTVNETVRGVIEGDPNRISTMKKWLQHEGSPGSKIEKVHFISETPIKNYSFQDFEIRY